MIIPSLVTARTALCSLNVGSNPIFAWSATSPIFTSQLRWRKRTRKPIWLPRAPSKLFVLPKPDKYEDEKTQVRELEKRYITQMHSINELFRVHFYEPTLGAGGFSQDEITSEIDEQERLLQENEEENRRVAAERESRNAKARQLREEDLVSQQVEFDREMERKSSELDIKVRQEISRSKTYIDEDKLEEAILDAINNPIHYDFAISLHGDVIYDDRLHPYAFKPSALPETSSQTAEWADCRPEKLKLQKILDFTTEKDISVKHGAFENVSDESRV